MESFSNPPPPEYIFDTTTSTSNTKRGSDNLALLAILYGALQ